jgi:FMN reductase
VAPKIVGLGGSLATRSQSRAALVTALAGAEAAGSETELLDLRELDLPMYNPEAEPTATTLRMIELLESADGLLWSSPLYQGSISGSFKNALDWLHLPSGSVYLTDKVIGLISVAGGTQGLQAINTMEFCVRALRAWAVPLVVPVPQAARVFDDDGHPQDEAVERQLKMLGSEVVRVAEHFATEESPNHEEVCARAAERLTAAGVSASKGSA